MFSALSIQNLKRYFFNKNYLTPHSGFTLKTRSGASDEYHKGFTFSGASDKSRKGFTLIEILVVIAIMGIITSGAIAAYNNFNKAQAIQRVALEIKSKLRESQNRSVVGKKDPDCRKDEYTATSGPVTEPADNRDDYILRGHYVVFDTTADTKYTRDQICSPAPNQLTSGGDISNLDREEIFFPTTINITSVSCSGAGLIDTLLINFQPLSEGIEFYKNVDNLLTTPSSSSENITSACSEALITINDGSNNQIIKITKFGLINIQ